MTTTTFERAVEPRTADPEPHTPGPWQFVPDLPRSVYAGTDADPICIGRTDLPNIPLAEASANARMFAAAPDMLAALRALVAECRAHLDYEDDEDMEAACDAAEAAISAAEGRR